MTTLRRRPPRRRLLGLAAFGLGLLLLPLPGLPAQPPPPKEKTNPAADATLPAEWVKAMTWRSIGPANMGGRITALAVCEADPTIYYLATASGGLLKTTNNGVTFQHQFDRESTVSLGDVCVAPSNPNIVWVGTGEGNPRNSVSYGDGVYKSLDGGKTWKNMGLKKTFQIGRIAIHPQNPDIVYVGALGRLYGPSAERGLFKTSDGGKSWTRVLYTDDHTGVIDVKMHPADPDTLLVAMWERRRDGFDSYLGGPLPDGLDTYDPIKRWSKSAGIYRTTDGGKNFQRMTRGLPTNPLGRIGLDYYRKDPRVVYAILDCEKIGMGTPPKVVAAAGYLGIQGEDADPGPGARLTVVTPGGPAEKSGLQAGDLIQALGTVKVMSYADLIDAIQQHGAGDKVKFKIRRDQRPREVEVTFGKRPRPAGGIGGPGGPKKNRPYHAYYGGQKENVQDQQGLDSFEYGGVYKSTDGGESWARVNSLNPRPMYFSEIRVDPTDERYLYVLGVALHRSSNGGKTFRPDGGRGVHADHHALWIDPRDSRHMVVGGDGGHYVTYDRMSNWDHVNTAALGQFYHVAVSTKKPYWVYGGLQDNGTWGGPSMGLRGRGSVNEEWLAIGGGDGFVCRVDPTDPDLIYFESQNGVMARRHLKTGERSPIRAVPAKGAPPYRFNWNTPFLLSSHNSRIFYSAGNYVFRSVQRGDDLRIISPEIARTKRGSATAVAESPKNPDVLWAGTDDGALWVTRDGGKNWTEVAAKVGLPAPYWVATIETSRAAEGRAYVAFDGHRSDDDHPYVYVTEDFGQTWKSLRGNLPAFGSTRCLREDVINPELFYLGTEFAVFVSLNRGASWARLNNNLPTVAVHEIAVHPTAGEIVAATHGRSLWILDVSALRQMTPKALQAKANLYRPKNAVSWRLRPATGGTNRRFVGQNPPPGAQLYYSLKEKAGQVSLKVLDINGKAVREMKGPTAPGLHRVTWDLTQPRTGGKPKGKFLGFAPRALVRSGDYRAVLTVDGQEFSASFRVEADPTAPPAGFAEDEGDGRPIRPTDH